MDNKQWAPSVILVDADYLDRVAFDLTVNFERMIGRRIPQADLCHWIDCIALDGGLRPASMKPKYTSFTPRRKKPSDTSPLLLYRRHQRFEFLRQPGTFQPVCFPRRRDCFG
ncbi:MAG: DUF6621 family protein [Prevotellamassilia sp.]